MTRVLHLSLKAKYFDAIKAGEKDEEYRLVNDHWSKRLENRTYDVIHFTSGYPKANDYDKHLLVAYAGWHRKTLLHPHFGPDPVDVYAIYIHLAL